MNGGVFHVGGGGDASAVGGGGGDGAGVHQAHGGKLPLAGLGALAVGEVAGGVPQGAGRCWRPRRLRRSRGRFRSWTF